MKVKLIIVICFISLAGLGAEEYTLDMLIESLENSIHFERTYAIERMGHHNYKNSRALLYPQIDGNIPLSISGLDEKNVTSGINSESTQSITAEPGISISQYLPTAGILTAQISDAITVIPVTEINSVSLLTDPKWTNTTSLSINLSQPVFFKGAFDAALEITEKTYENNNLDVLEARNSLAISAVRNFYDLKQALFNLELIQIRFRNDKETYKRINQEFEMGLWTKSKLYQAKSILIKSEIDLVESTQKLETARQTIISNYSLPPEFKVTPNVESLSFGELDYDTVIEKIINSSTGISKAKNLLNMQKASMIVLRKDNGPVLNLGGAYTYLNDFENLESNRKVFSISLGLTGNIFDGGASNAKMDSERAVLQQLEISLTTILIDLEIETKSILNSLSRSSQLTELYNFQEEAAQYEFNKGVKDLELGQITEKDLSELQINLENTRMSKQQNVINTNMFYLQLANLQGLDLMQHSIVRNNK